MHAWGGVVTQFLSVCQFYCTFRQKLTRKTTDKNWVTPAPGPAPPHAYTPYKHIAVCIILDINIFVTLKSDKLSVIYYPRELIMM